MAGLALVRRPGPRLADGQLTHLTRLPVDPARATAQHAAYRQALADRGWRVVEVPPADDLPDAPFVEDTAVPLDGRVVLTRPGHPSRVAEVPGVAATLDALGVPTVALPAGRLDGGDVLRVGDVLLVGLSSRTDEAGAAALADLAAADGLTVRPVRVTGALHLKTAVTALPDRTLLGVPDLVDAAALGAPVLPVPEPAGADVLLLGGDRVGLSAAAPRTAALLADRGLAPVPLELGEFEALEAGPTCLSILLP
jgi:dimethylargininase